MDVVFIEKPSWSHTDDKHWHLGRGNKVIPQNYRRVVCVCFED